MTRAALLTLLGEGPQHGYQIMQELEERSGGMWRPSAGSVYPALEKLEADGLVTVDQAAEGDKKTYELTDAGRAALEKIRNQGPPWKAAMVDAEPGVMQLREAMMQLGSAAMQVAQTGTDEQRARAGEVLTKARKQLYGILAED